MFKKVVLFVLLGLVCSPVRAVVHRLQLCPSNCKTQVCKKLAEEVEFEFELSKDFLLPVCAKTKGPMKDSDFRAEFSDLQAAREILVEVHCHGSEKCLSKKYSRQMKAAALTSAVVSDLKLAMKPKIKVVEKATVPVVTTPPIIQDEWDRVVIAPEAQPSIALNPQVSTEVTLAHTPALGSVTMSFGAENWNYFFEADKEPDRIAPIHSRIYPRALFSASVWPTSFLRISTSLSASMLTFRLRANQPVEGDGQLIMAQMYHSEALAAFLAPIGGILHLGLDSGYEFQAFAVEKHRLAERSVTVVPSFQSHALRIGPRMVIGALSDKGVIDLGAGFYPYVHYFESPDEPSTKKSVFAWSAHGLIRLMLGSEMFADAMMRASAFHVRFEDEPQRESISGEKWGTGKVVNASASAAVGLGWLF